MTNEQMNIAVAETCGWTDIKHGVGFRPVAKEFSDESKSFVPDYCNDLNAMWEAEAHLTPDQQVEFAYQLSEIVAPITGESWMLIHASAFSRAKAFLRTVGKWEEAE